MSDYRITVLSFGILAIFLILTLMLLAFLLTRSTRTANQWIQMMLSDQMLENQKLRNQLMGKTISDVAHLNQLTLPPPEADHDSDSPPDYVNLEEVITSEEELAKQGYQLGDISDDLAASGWTTPVTRKAPDGSVIAYDV